MPPTQFNSFTSVSPIRSGSFCSPSRNDQPLTYKVWIVIMHVASKGGYVCMYVGNISEISKQLIFIKYRNLKKWVHILQNLYIILWIFRDQIIYFSRKVLSLGSNISKINLWENIQYIYLRILDDKSGNKYIFVGKYLRKLT